MTPVSETVTLEASGDLEIPADNRRGRSATHVARVCRRRGRHISLTIGFADLSPVVGEAAPTDVDGDGNFEDINGDGTMTVADVQALFANRNSAVIEDNPQAFDFNGDTKVSVADVQALFTDVMR